MMAQQRRNSVLSIVVVALIREEKRMVTLSRPSSPLESPIRHRKLRALNRLRAEAPRDLAIGIDVSLSGQIDWQWAEFRGLSE